MTAAKRRPQPRPRRAHPAPVVGNTRERIALWLIVLGGGVAVLPGGLERFALPKCFVVLIGAVLALRVRNGQVPRRAALVIAAGAGVLVIAAAVSSEPVAALFGRSPRYEGLIVLPVYVATLVAGVRLLGPQRGQDSDAVVTRALTVGIAAIGLLAIIEAAGGRVLSSDVARPGSLLGNASDQGEWALLALGPLLAAALARRTKWLIGAAAASLLVIGLSASRGALLGGIATLLVVAVFDLRAASRRWIAGAVVALAVLAFVIPATRHRVVDAFNGKVSTGHGRVLLWQETADLLSHHPVLGVGPSGFLDAVPRFHTRKWERDVGPANPVDSPHNVALQATAAGGIPLGLLLVVLAGIGVLSVRGSRAPPGVVASLVGYAVALQFHFTSPGPTTLACFWFGAVVAVPPGQVAVWQRRANVATEVLCIGLAAVIGFALIGDLVAKHAYDAANRGSLTAADNDFVAARVLRPWDADLLSGAGHAFAVVADRGESGASQLSLKWTGRAEDWLPDSPFVLADRAAAEEDLGRYQQAAALLDRALRFDPLNPDNILRRGVVAAELHDNAGAEQRFLEVTRLRPHDPQPWHDLAILYQQEGRAADAARAQATARRLGG